MSFIISKWKTKNRVSHASFKWRKETKKSECCSEVETVTYGLKVSGHKAVSKLERLVKRLNKYKVNPNDDATINKHLDIVNRIKVSQADIDKMFKPK